MNTMSSPTSNDVTDTDGFIGVVVVTKNGGLLQQQIPAHFTSWNDAKDALWNVCQEGKSSKKKKPTSFVRLHSFTKYSCPRGHRTNCGLDEDETILLYGSDDGKAGHENKYEFPPPIDNDIYFGNLCLMKRDEDKRPIPLSIKQWKAFYECLFGGFDDCVSEGEESNDDDDEYADLPSTRHGYAKDGFVVDDDEDDEGNDDAEYSGEETEDEEEEYYYTDDSLES